MHHVCWFGPRPVNRLCLHLSLFFFFWGGGGCITIRHKCHMTVLPAEAQAAQPRRALRHPQAREGRARPPLLFSTRASEHADGRAPTAFAPRSMPTAERRGRCASEHADDRALTAIAPWNIPTAKAALRCLPLDPRPVAPRRSPSAYSECTQMSRRMNGLGAWLSSSRRRRRRAGRLDTRPHRRALYVPIAYNFVAYMQGGRTQGHASRPHI